MTTGIKELNAVVAKGFSTKNDIERLKSFYLKWLVDHILYQDRKLIRLNQERHFHILGCTLSLKD